MAVQADYNSIAQKIYVAYFGRPADVLGLSNMTAQLLAANVPVTGVTTADTTAFVNAYSTNATIKSIVDNFGTSPESLALYGASTTSDAAFVNAIYLNVLGRSPLLAGLQFWTNALNPTNSTGTMTRGEAALRIMEGALNNTSDQGVIDAAGIANKITAASNFTLNQDTTAEVLGYSGATAAAAARTWLSAVTSDAATLTAADASLATTITTITALSYTYSLAAAATSADEGGTATFTLTTTNVPNGTVVSYTIGGVTAADVTGGLLTGTATVTNNTATISVATVADFLTEGAEALTVSIDNTTATASATVNDTSTTPTYTLTGDAAVNEGASATYTITSSDAADTSTQTYTVAGTGVDATDVDALTGTVTLVGGVGTITVAVAADATTEGTENMTVTAGLQTATTAVADPSIPPVMTADSVSGTIVNGQGTAIMTPAEIAAFASNDTTSAAGAISTGTVTIDMASAVGGQLVALDNGNTMFVADAGVRQGTFTYSTSDITGMTGTVNVTLNSAPAITSAATLAATEDIAATGTVTATDADADTLTYTFGAATNGTVTAVDGAYTYTPNANYNGSDTFTVTVSDGYTTATQDIAVTVAAVNDDPQVLTPAPAAVAVVAGGTATVDLSLYATDPDVGATLTYTVDAATANGGVVTLSGSTATITYAEGGGAAALGADSFGMTVTDGVIVTPVAATVTLDVTNTAPVAGALALTAKTGVAQTIDLAAGTVVAAGVTTTFTTPVVDADGNTLTPVVTVGSVSAGGSAEVLNGQIVYTSTVGYVGTETVTYTVTDGFGGTSAPATITFTVASNTGGTSAADLLYGSTAAEVIDGLAGNDTIVGGGGADTINGGDGNDVVTFNDNAPAINGGAGVDTLVVNGDALSGQFDFGAALLGIDENTDGQSTTAIVRNFENMDASRANNAITLQGDNASTTSIITGNSNDTLTIDESTGTGVVITTNDGNDTVTVTAAGTYSIDGGAGNDTINGSALVDTILGGTGNDQITGDGGADMLYGDAGNDTFIFASAANLLAAGTVSGGTGTDVIQLVNGANAFTVAAADLLKVNSIETINADTLTTTMSVTLTDAVYTANGNTAMTVDGNNIDGALTIVAGALTAANSVTAILTTTDNLADNVVGGAGNDTFTISGTAIASDADVITGGAGTDTISINNAVAVNANFTGATVTTIENITVAGTVADVSITTADVLLTAAGTMTVSAAAMTDATTVFTFVGSGETTGATSLFNITGGAGNDVITGGSGNDIIDGGAGNDGITGGVATDNLTGGAGNDTFTVATSAHFIGLAAVETVAGGTGTDNIAISLGANATAVAAADLLGISGIETINITNANTQTASITLTNAVYTANGQTFTVVNKYAAATDDGITVDGSALTGTNAIDFTASEAAGSDETVTGGAANDTFRFATTANAASATTLDVNDSLTGGAGTDTLTVSLVTTALTAVTLTNVATIEAITVSNVGADTTALAAGITLADGNFDTITGAIITASGMYGALTFNAAAEDDSTFIITGGAAGDTITGGALADTIDGGAGADSLVGGAGVDSLTGGAGDDTIDGGSGIDVMDGGAGNDTITIDNVAEAVTDSGTDTSDTLIVSHTGVGGAIIVDLSSATDQITLWNGLTNSAVQLGFENINVSAYSNSAGADITGSSGANIITGTTQTDVIAGGAGNDSISGGGGIDNLTGDAGADNFMFTTSAATSNAPTATNATRVLDWTDGTDFIAISAGATFGTAGNVGLAAGAGVAGSSVAIAAGATVVQTVAQSVAAAQVTAGADLIKLTTGVASGTTDQTTFNAAIGSSTVTTMTASTVHLVSWYDTTLSQAVFAAVDLAGAGTNTVLETGDTVTIIGRVDMTAGVYGTFTTADILFY